MPRYIGELGTDAYGVKIDEVRIGVISLNAAQAIAADTNHVLAGLAGSQLGPATTNVPLASPPYPRNITIVPGGVTADVPAGNITVNGTDFDDQPISEDFAFLANATAATVGAMAFKTVTTITLPQQDGAGATYDVGFGDKIGLPFKLAYNAVLGATINGVRETTFPTVAYSSTVLASNTVDLNSNLAGTPVKIFIALD